MNQKIGRVMVCTMAATLAFLGTELSAEAKIRESVIGEHIEGEHWRVSLQGENEWNGVSELSPNPLSRQISKLEEVGEEAAFRNLVIAQVDSYVNVRSLPSEEGEILGKLYNNSVGSFLSEENGWYKISSGTVTGYVKGEYCVTGQEAVEIARQVRKRIATVTTQTLFVRREPTTESAVIGMVPETEQLVVSEEVTGWVKVEVEEGSGWVSADYVSFHDEFVHAESKEEERKRLEKEEAERKKAREAARKAAQKNNSGKGTATGGSSQSAGNTSGGNTSNLSGSGVVDNGSADTGRQVADYALQFLGNPYVYGGTSLTKGADCSGFVQSVYKNFGVSLPRTSGEQRSSGYAVDGLDNARPGDLVCYSGHIGIYIGDGKIVHASSAKTGIITSQATYRKILSIRRIF